MTKVLTTKEYKAIEAKHSNVLEMTLTKVENYNLKPFGRFLVKAKTHQGHLPHILPFMEVTLKYDTGMPVPEEQDKKIIKFMIKHKSDVLIDRRGNFYTRAGVGFSEIWHRKLSEYKTFLYKKELEDCPESWETYIESLKSY